MRARAQVIINLPSLRKVLMEDVAWVSDHYPKQACISIVGQVQSSRGRLWQGFATLQFTYQLINQSIDQSDNQSVNRSISQSQSIDQSANHSQSISQPITVSQFINKSIDHSPKHSQSIDQSANHSQSVDQSANRSQSISQPITVSQSISQPVTVSQSINQPIAVNRSVSQSQSVNRSVSQSQSFSRSINRSVRKTIARLLRVSSTSSNKTTITVYAFTLSFYLSMCACQFVRVLCVCMSACLSLFPVDVSSTVYPLASCDILTVSFMLCSTQAP